MNKLKHTNKLIASIAVFADLCNSDNDLKKILTEFVKSVFVLEKNYSMESVEVTRLLKKHYDFDLPEAVIKVCLNSLVTNSLATKNTGKYSVVDKKIQTDELIKKFDEKKEIQLKIENKLIVHCEKLTGHTFNETERKEVIDGFISYLMDNGVSEKYSTLISAFVIQRASNRKFVQELSQIKEGLILISGLSYTSDLNEISVWENELTIFLDTEHLFNSAGYNGGVYKKLFDDFYKLVSEINQNSMKKSQKKIIHLKYFKDTKEEADNFFYVAQKIIKREDNISPQNIAMQTICNGCSNVSDVLRKKTDFETNLKTRGITEQAEFDLYSKPEFIVEDQQLIEKYESKYDEKQIVDILTNYSKINFLRKGVNRTSFEKIGYIILTGKIASLVMSKDLEIKTEAKDIPFATDIYFITNRLWYKLNKGFNDSTNLPATLDIVVKAQIVLSTQVNRSIDKEYENLKSQVKSGSLSTESAQQWYNSLREEAKKPEEINLATVEKSVDLIFENDFEKYVKEKEHLKGEVEVGKAAMKELKQLKFKEQKEKKRKLKLRLKAKLGIFAILLSLTIISLIVGTIYLISLLKTDSDTPISLIGFGIGIIVEGWLLLKWLLLFFKKFKKYSRNEYLNQVSKIL